MRALWVVRTSMSRREKLDKMLMTAEKLNQNTLLVQVNARGEAYYDSEILPRVADIEKGLDPLGYVCQRGKELGMKIQAWINTFTVGEFNSSPETTGHVLGKHPDWVMFDDEGRSLLEFPREKADVNLPTPMLDPGLPEVREFLESIYREVAREYPVDGVHLDYIRYPGKKYGYNPGSVEKFKQEKGLDPFKLSNSEEEGIWDNWRRDRVTELLANIYSGVKEENPECLVTSAVYPDVSDAAYNRMQNWPHWLERGLLDQIMPMAYSTSEEEVKQQIKKALEISGKTPVIAGLGAYRMLEDSRRLERIIRQVQKIGADGTALFSYDTLVTKPELVEFLSRNVFKEEL